MKNQKENSHNLCKKNSLCKINNLYEMENLRKYLQSLNELENAMDDFPVLYNNANLSDKDVFFNDKILELIEGQKEIVKKELKKFEKAWIRRESV